MSSKKTDREFNKLRNKINEQNEYFTKEIEMIKMIPIEILEMKNSVKEKKNEVTNIGNRADQVEEKISNSTDRNLETKKEEERDLTTCNHHAFVHVHKSFFFFTGYPHPLTPPPLTRAVSGLSMRLSPFCLLVQFVY